MQFVEFLDFIGRVADFVYKSHDELMLYEKINFILDLILAIINVNRKLPPMFEEVSSDDDDY